MSTRRLNTFTQMTDGYPHVLLDLKMWNLSKDKYFPCAHAYESACPYCSMFLYFDMYHRPLMAASEGHTSRESTASE